MQVRRHRPLAVAGVAASATFVLSTGARLVPNDTVAPLVTVRRATAWKSSDPAPYGVQENALGADVYTVPKLRTLKLAAGASATITASCRPGAEVYFAAPEFVGQLLIDGVWKPTLHDRQPGIYSGAPLARVGTADAAGNVRLELKADRASTVANTALACLDRDRLAAAVQELTASAPAAVEVGGHSITINRMPGRAATVAVSVINLNGWHCTVDGKATKPMTQAGLLTVAVGPTATHIACSYRTPGTRLGLATGAASLIALLLLIAVLSRRRETPPST
jgi:hypothetical protein